MASIKCGSCKGTHEEVWQVKACYGIDYSASWPKGDPTEKQAATQLALYAGAVPTPVDELRARRTVLAQITEGIYETPDQTIVKVQVAVHGSGRLYAKKLRITEWKIDPKTDDMVAAGGHFVFESGLIHKLRPEWRVTKERAAEFGRLYGFCIRCGATLTDEKSIEAGIGPICAGKFG